MILALFIFKIVQTDMKAIKNSYIFNRKIIL